MAAEFGDTLHATEQFGDSSGERLTQATQRTFNLLASRVLVLEMVCECVIATLPTSQRRPIRLPTRPHIL